MRRGGGENGAVSDPADLGVVEATALLRERRLSSSELVTACLARIRERDGTHSHAGDAGSINAWVRVYEEDALSAAAHADALLAAGHDEIPPLRGIPVGLKDLYAVAGKPLTGSSLVLAEVPQRDSDVWARLSSAGAILLGHLHTHELAIGGTTDQVGNPWALERSAGGSSGGSAAALAARMVPAATGTDTAGSLRIPSALSGTSAIKPTRGLVSLAGVVPLAVSLDHAGPMARSLADCAVLLAAMAGPDEGRPQSALSRPPGADALAPRPGPQPLAGVRLALSPRIGSVELEADVAGSFDAALAACRGLGATVVDLPPPPAPLDVGDDFLDVLCAELLAYHRRFDDRRDEYRPSIREWVEEGERRGTSAEAYVAAQMRRREATATWAQWLRANGIDAVAEPTVPVTAPPRGDGYEHAGSDYVLISLTHYWDWIGFPVVSLPSGVGARSGLPCGISLVGRAGGDAELLVLGGGLQAELGVPEPPVGR
jgi:aspartyl-tRNA(Asn)/glutamyl-tRNA(Gln) amidotransferase subunit A